MTAALLFSLLPSAPPSAGVPIPYAPRMDEWVTCILLACFFVSSWVLSRSGRFLWQQARDFVLHRERSDLFAVSTGGDVRFLLLLIGQTCVLAGVYLFDYFSGADPRLVRHVPSWMAIGTYVAACVFFVFAKWLLYGFLGWIFLDKEQTALWMESYSTLLYYLGFVLFPLVLLVVYFNVALPIVALAGVLLFVFLKILTVYKWLRLFCRHLYGCFWVILYFCALEILPCLVLYRGLELLNEYWIIKH